MLKNFVRHILYITINVIAIFIIIQIGIRVTQSAFEFGRSFMLEHINSQDEEEEVTQDPTYLQETQEETQEETLETEVTQ